VLWRPLCLFTQDEPFHVPMTQLYCRGDLLTWDSKVTTFPGLYVIGAGYAWASKLLLGWTGVGLVRRGAVFSTPGHAAGAGSTVASTALRSKDTFVVPLHAVQLVCVCCCLMHPAAGACGHVSCLPLLHVVLQHHQQECRTCSEA
jgi:hypothetical protein